VKETSEELHVDELRQRLRSMGYLDAGVNRFVLGPATDRRRPSTIRRTRAIRVNRPILGSVVTIVSWFADPAWHGLSLHVAGTSLFVITFPLLAFGAHCLDLLEKEKRA